MGSLNEENKQLKNKISIQQKDIDYLRDENEELKMLVEMLKRKHKSEDSYKER